MATKGQKTAVLQLLNRLATQPSGSDLTAYIDEICNQFGFARQRAESGQDYFVNLADLSETQRMELLGAPRLFEE